MPLETHTLNCDVLVAGGGAAGVPCALAAARCGAKVILCQDRPVLGGNASSEVRMHIVGANGTGSFDRGSELETEAREAGIIEEIRLDNCVLNPQRSASMFDLILYDKCRAEPNLTLLLNTTVTAVRKRGDRIEFATAERQSTEDRFEIYANVFVDCTGDGRLAVEAGAAFSEGREGREQFGETLAVDLGDRQRLGSTILLQARQHERSATVDGAFPLADHTPLCSQDKVCAPAADQ
jgi:flavin-dependent dehydrogenase